ncbi:MAG: replication-relaxation family protein [Patescibacteria group bacterium]
MTLPNITNKQIEILNLIYKYRFLNRIQIQAFLNHKDHRRINSWLKDLTEKEYLNRIYPNSAVIVMSPTIYYAGINAIRYFKLLDQDNNTYLKKLYRDNERTENFIAEQLLIADSGLHLIERNKERGIHYEFLTAADVTSNSIYKFMEDLSPQLIYTKKTKSEFKQFVFVILDSAQPKYIIKKKMKSYIELFFTNEWEENTGKSFPIILFACQTLALMIYAKRTMRWLLDDYQNPEEFKAWFATNDDIREQGISAEIWE